MANTVQTYYPTIPKEIDPHSRILFDLIFKTFINHTAAISQVSNGQVTNNTTVVENIAQSSGSGGGSTIPGLGGVNDQSGQTVYVTTVSDNGVLLILNDASAVAVTLNSGVSSPYLLFVTNLGAGLVTFTPTSGTINGNATFTLASNYTTLLAFDGANWFATAAQFSIADISGLSAALALLAPLASPALTGTPTAPTASPGTDDTQIATTAYADAAVAVETTRAEAAEALLAPIASPTFTGTVTQPDSAVLTVATTATSATAGAATALPATPAIYLEISVNGTIYKFPGYLV